MDTESNYKNIDCPVDDLLYLIKQDDVEQLRNALLEVIDKSQPGGEIYLYEQGYSVFNTKEKNFTPTLLTCRGTKNCKNKANGILLSTGVEPISFKGFKDLSDDKIVQVFTVESERSTRGLLITTNDKVFNEKYINTLLNAYNSQVNILRNKDTDSLTGLLNRQSFDLKLTKSLTKFGFENRNSDELCGHCFALLDIDFFKTINDKYGHVYGDEVLILFSNIMKETFRDSDMLFRYGGEEFSVLLDNVTQDQAEIILNRFRENVADYDFPMGDKVTVSIGFCEFSNHAPLTKITEQADKALYYAKNHGRNKTYSYEKLLSENKIQINIYNKNDIEIF